jgi:type III secretion system YscI/HrpB-like protein
MISKVGIHQQNFELSESLNSFYEEKNSPAQEEIDLFLSAIKKDPSDMNISEQFINKISEMSVDFKNKKEDIHNGFKTTKSSDDYASMIQSLREISDYGFQTAVLTKVVSKATQAVEKLTNLN